MTKSIKLIIVIVALGIVVTSIFIYKNYKQKEEENYKQVRLYNRYLDDYTTFMPIGGKLVVNEKTYKHFYENARFSKDSLACKIKVSNNEGIYPTNIYELYQASLTIPDFFEKYAINSYIYELTEEEMDELIAQINIGLDVDKATSDEVNAWLEKVVKERMIIEGETPPK